MLPLYLLTNAKGQQLHIELKSGEVIEGTLTNVDNWMNLTLSDVSEFRTAETSPQVEVLKSSEIYLRGAYIKYIKLQDDIINTMRQQMNNNMAGGIGGGGNKNYRKYNSGGGNQGSGGRKGNYGGGSGNLNRRSYHSNNSNNNSSGGGSSNNNNNNNTDNNRRSYQQGSRMSGNFNSSTDIHLQSRAGGVRGMISNIRSEPSSAGASTLEI